MIIVKEQWEEPIKIKEQQGMIMTLKYVVGENVLLNRRNKYVGRYLLKIRGTEGYHKIMN